MGGERGSIPRGTGSQRKKDWRTRRHQKIKSSGREGGAESGRDEILVLGESLVQMLLTFGL